MKWLPYKSFAIVTSLTPDAVQSDLEAEVSSDGNLVLFPRFRRRRDGSFLGIVANGTFRIRPQTLNGNLFLPNISGVISAWPDGSRIQGIMRVHPLAPLLMCGWVMLSAIAAGFLLSLNPNVHIAGFATLFCGQLVLGYLYMMYSFNKACSRAAKTLAEILQGTIEPA